MRNRDLSEALEQQTATSEILRVISSSPTDLQPVFETILANATRLCGTRNAGLYRFDGELLHFAAGHNLSPEMIARQQSNPVRPGRESANRRAALERRTIHVPDVLAAVDFNAYETETYRREGRRSTLAVPLLKEDTLLGVIVTSHYDEVKPFTDNQIKLVETFADQAVIAIENVRLFKELEQRNAELREALEHQTATAEVLGIISRSPTDVQPVLDAIVESAARVCGIDDVALRLREGDAMVSRAHFGLIPIATSRVEMSIDEPRFPWMREHGTLHIPDRREQNIIPTVGSVSEWRTLLGVPLCQQRELIGALFARRIDVRPFTPTQIKLLETFADQAVIAIENVRLFQELTESLEQQTATSEILGVIASSPTDIQPVLDVVAENAARLCDATDAVIHRIDGDKLRSGARYGLLPTRRGSRGRAPRQRRALCPARRWRCRRTGDRAHRVLLAPSRTAASLPARTAPSRPEIDHQHLAAPLAEGLLPSFGIGQRDREQRVGGATHGVVAMAAGPPTERHAPAAAIANRTISLRDMRVAVPGGARSAEPAAGRRRGHDRGARRRRSERQ